MVKKSPRAVIDYHNRSVNITLMKTILLGYWRTLDRTGREQLAKQCGTSANHLRNIAYGQKTCGEGLAVALERETGGRVRCEDLRPDVDWNYLRTSGDFEAVHDVKS